MLRVASSTAPELLEEGSYILVETPEEMMNKEGWMLIPERKDWRARVELSTVVTVKKCSPHSVIIGHHQVLAKCHPVLGVNTYVEMCIVHVRNTAFTLKFDLSDLKLVWLWNRKLTHQLSDLPELFSTDDMDIGSAKSGQHTFRLIDATPFRERPQR